MATRVYVRSEGTPDLTPSTWNFANQINPVSLPGTLIKNSGSAMTSKTEATGTTNPTARAMGRTILGPLKAQTISGTIKGQMRGMESNAGANATLAMAVKIIKSDGTDRAVLLAQTASDSATSTHELTTTLTNMSFQDASESASISLTSQSASDGDYLVIEWGFRSATSQDRNITLSYGNDSATDLPEDTSTTAANNPWFEFSATISIVRATVGSSAGVGASSVVGAAIGSMTGSAAGTVGGSAVGASFVASTGSSSGVGASSVIGAATGAGIGSSAGASSQSGVGASTSASTGQSSGITTLSGTLAVEVATAGSANGTSTVSGSILAFTSSVGLSEGVSLASGVGLSISWTQGSAQGTSSTNGGLEAVATAVGSSQGDSTLSGITISITAGVATTSSISASDFIGAAIGSGTATAAGIGSVSIIGNEIHWANGSAISISTIQGFIGEDESVAFASGLAVVLGVGLRVINLTPDESVNMPAENRTISVYGESRSASVIAPMSHTVSVPSEPRTVKV